MKILLASHIDPDAVAQLREDHDVALAVGAAEDELAEAVVDREVIVFRSGVTLSTKVLAQAPDLKLLVRAGSGLDNLDLDYIDRRGIVLQRVPGPGAQAVAELTFGLMLCLARGILVGDRGLREGRWLKPELVGHNLRGKTLGVVGLGSIGTRVAALGTAWGMSPIGCVQQPTPQRAEAFAERGIRLVDLPTVLEEADFVTIHVPLDDHSRGLIGRTELARMKPGSFLVNVARGGVVDELALAEALQGGGRQPQGAALDVHVAEGDGRVSPLAGLSNVVLTPHIGAMTIDAQREIGREVVRIIEGAHE
jgi:D-3-phosphoglycerate dehydrogenase / 2-oxoglutarate reductase